MKNYKVRLTLMDENDNSKGSVDITSDQIYSLKEIYGVDIFALSLNQLLQTVDKEKHTNGNNTK